MKELGINSHYWQLRYKRNKSGNNGPLTLKSFLSLSRILLKSNAYKIPLSFLLAF